MHEKEDMLAEAVKSIADVGEMVKGNAETVKGINETVSGLKADNEAIHKELAALQQNQSAPEATKAEATDAGTMFVKSAGYEDFKKSYRGNRNANYRFEMKAAAPETTQASNSYSRTAFALPASLGLVSDPRQVLNIANLFGRIQINTNSYEFVRYNYKTTLTATGPASVAEGAAKPESNYGGTIQTGTIKTLATWTKLTEQMIADNANIVSFINDDLPYQLDKVIEYQILRGSGSNGEFSGLNQSGNFTDYITGITFGANDTEIDLVLRVKSAMEAAGVTGVMLLLNPADWCKVLTAKNVNKDYLIPGIVDIPTKTIWGVPVVTNPFVAAGKFYLGNFAEAGKIVEREDLAIEMDREQDDFTKNLMTLRVERRLDFAVMQPMAVCYGDFAIPA